MIQMGVTYIHAIGLKVFNSKKKKNFQKPTKVYIHSYLFTLQYMEISPNVSSFYHIKYNISGK